MTRQALRDACADYALTVPATLDDCREIFDDLKAKIAVGVALDVVLVNERTIHVTAGVHDSAYSVEIQA